ncbi:MAG TPA: rhomboid family intramembrane serine protease [Bacteroidia bacterium]|jgi:membrane associated rhomboid family serine protease|nr:rhomboid family intramembrane serine protease [Bacteroidia bacterium]
MNYIQRPNFNSTPVVKNLLIANIAMFVITYIVRSTQGYDLDNILGLHYFTSGNFKPHQLITFLFMHGSILHIAFNMYALWIFGKILENHWGSKRLLTYYMICGIGSGITQELAWYYYMHHDQALLSLPADQYQLMIDSVNAIGASGAIFGLLLAFGMIFPNVPLYIMFIPVPIKAKYLVIGYGLYELFGGISNQAGDNVAHFAHIGGLIFGFILIMIWKRNRTFH